MRILATAAFAFAAAVFSTLVLPEGSWLPMGLAALAGMTLCALLRRCTAKTEAKRRRNFLRAALICGGAALGLLYTVGYRQVVLTPVQALDGRTVRFEAVVREWPVSRDHGRWQVPVEGGEEGEKALSALLFTDDQGASLRPGDRVTGVAHCTAATHTRTGEDITYYTAKGIFLQADLYGKLTVEPGAEPSWRYWPAYLSRMLKGGIDQAFPPDVAPVVQGIVTGGRENLSDTFTSSLQRTGLSHTVAVSGMHLAFLAGAVTLLLGRGKRSGAVCTLILAVLFWGVAGGTPSVSRAAMMLALLQIAPLLGRERDSFTALAFALAVLLLWNPFSAAHVGLQLSFGAVAGILLVSDRVQDAMIDFFHLDRPRKSLVVRLALAVPRFLVATLSATLGASVLTVPLAALHFGLVSLVSPLSNLLTLWAVAGLFLGGLCVGLVACVLPGPAAVLAFPFTLLGHYLNWVVQSLGRMPLAALPLNSFYYKAWVVYLCLLLALAALVRGQKGWIIPGCAAVTALTACFWFTALSFQSGGLTAAVLDVGQGQSVLLRLDSHLVLVDCGGDGVQDAGDTAADYLQTRGGDKLDALVVSHYHSDHANGVPELLRRVEVNLLLLPDVEEGDPLREEILTLAAERGVEVRFVHSDTRLDFPGGQSLTVFPPLQSAGETNELGLCVLASAGDFDVLVPGDMSGQGEARLLAHTQLPKIEVLVAGHHGSATSTTQPLLDEIQPETAIISVGKNNRYGHPAQETLERLALAGTNIYRTDLQGTVTVRSGAD